MRSTEEEMRLHEQRGDQQNEVSERVEVTPLIKLSLSCFLEDIKENLQAELQETEARIDAKEKRLEEELKIVIEKINHLIQKKDSLLKQVGVLTPHLAASEGFQQMTGDEEPQGRHEAQQLSQAEMLKVEHVSKMVEEKWTQWEEIYTGSSIESAASSSSSSSAAAEAAVAAAAAAAAASSKGALVPQPEKWSPGCSSISSTDTDAAQLQDDFLELLSMACVFLV
ncbi:uncharacterized protein LOC111922159 isoform X2 [Cyanistes caeruleus]|uniref:uncharacterized protein LOC111922159 isoform X1 n=1 Tax=Cyanistes caeruleus TaxID=156563 RepID=UPI000CDB33DE|nr:uncharacterized protein LOC111922159 isoform X1 [Cyanistes caeruleus]XP_023773479.1 uncharacterized protein LOC111922159 isoform X2 [Cyanistes caeruleus]